ncbi:MAG TPA: ShlB/FhaC/HecB family hemolysin secretion/activation protein [Stellaceae bacterium]|nr:ShlB/FhaC/HecB family hemolysin secretion/activation protein [Stellaceae bacterium]
MTVDREYFVRSASALAAIVTFATLWIAVLGLAPAYGQAPPSRTALPSTVEPGRPPPSAAPAAPVENFDFFIQTPERAPVPRAEDQLVFVLNGIQITGATIYSDAELRPFYADLLGHEVKLTDILGIADAIEAKYRTAGFVLTRAYVPPQHVTNGVFTINVVEGYVAAIDTKGGSAATQRQVTDYLQPVTQQRPLQLRGMERALLLANDIPGVTASGLLRPSPNVAGASDLLVNLVPTPVSAGIGIDNRGSRYAGPWIAHADAEVNGILGPDQFYANISSVPNSLEKLYGLLRYQRMVGPDGASVSLLGYGSYGQPGSILRPFELITDSWAVGPRARYPILRSRAQSLYVEAGVARKDEQVSILGQPFSHDQWSTADASLTWVQSGLLNGNTTVTAGLTQGLPVLGATPSGSPNLSRPGAHTDFTKATFSAQRIQTLYGPVNLAVNMLGQYAFEPLVVGEQAAFGGDTIGRGYDPDVLVGDQGFGTSLELRYDYQPTNLPAYLPLNFAQPYVFYDAAGVWDRVANSLHTGASLSSAGLGLRARFPHQVSAGIEYAKTLTRLAANDDGNLTSRVLVDLSVRY